MELVDSKAMPAAANRFLQGGLCTLCLLTAQACACQAQAAFCQVPCPWQPLRAGTAWVSDLACCPADATAKQVMTNLPYDQMHAPVLGPAHPFQKDGVAAGMRNHRAGHVEVDNAPFTHTLICSHAPRSLVMCQHWVAGTASMSVLCSTFSARERLEGGVGAEATACLMQDYHMHTFHFDDQYHTHFSYGYSIAPGGQEIVGDQEAFLNKKGGALVPCVHVALEGLAPRPSSASSGLHPPHADSSERTRTVSSAKRLGKSCAVSFVRHRDVQPFSSEC